MKVAFFLPSLSGGGAERVTVNLLSALDSPAAQNDYPLKTQLVLGEASGPYLEQLPADVEVVDLQRPRMSRAIPALRRWVRQSKPDAVISHLSHANLANILSGTFRRHETKRIIVEHLTMSAYQGTARVDRWIRPLARRLYRKADAIVAVSEATARDLERQLGAAPDSVRVIYNPVVDQEMLKRADEEPQHPWLRDKQGPVIIAAGRLTAQKDFSTLISSMPAVRSRIDARLIILGEGELQHELRQQIDSLSLGRHVDLSGFVSNPYSIMRRADCLALSSRWEALPTVIIEALACGCPVVATDCPAGPAEILEQGRYGRLVPMQDPAELAKGILETLGAAPERDLLEQRGREFSFQRAAKSYYELIRELVVKQ